MPTSNSNSNQHLNGFRDADEASSYPLVSVKWKDAESQGGPSWEDSQEMLDFAKKPLVIVHTVGHLIHADDEKLAITDTVSGDQMGGVTKIPRLWIVEMVELEPRRQEIDGSLSIPSDDGQRSVG